MPVVAKLSEIPNLGKKQVTTEGQDILLVNLKGTIYAVESECPHQARRWLAPWSRMAISPVRVMGIVSN